MADINLLAKWRLLQAVVGDGELPAPATKVAARLIDHYNYTSRQCNPSYGRIAGDTGLTRRTVIKAITALEARGWITVNRTKGGETGKGARTNSFGLAFDRVPGEYYSLPPGEQNAPPPVQTVHSPGELFDTPPGEYYSPKPIEGEHGKRTRELTTVRTAASAADEAAFDRWYDTYPKQVARGRARKVYARILKTKAATVDELQAGAERFARQRAEQNSQYTPYPSKWLSDECWRDEPEAAVVYARAGAHASAVAGVFKGIDRGRSLDDEITDAAARSAAVGQRRIG